MTPKPRTKNKIKIWLVNSFRNVYKLSYTRQYISIKKIRQSCTSNIVLELWQVEKTKKDKEVNLNLNTDIVLSKNCHSEMGNLGWGAYLEYVLKIYLILL